MSREAPARKAAAYAIALACGVLLLFTLMPLDAIIGTGGLWRSPAADMAQGLTGHLALQQDAWRLPPLFAKNLFWPHGVSIALTDSNPLFSLTAKLLATVRGSRRTCWGCGSPRAGCCSPWRLCTRCGH